MTDPKASPDPTTSASASKLVVNAIIELTNIVESMHQRISPLSRLTDTSANERTRGLTGLVYESIRTTTELVGKAIDIPLQVISEKLSESERSARSEMLLAGLNGVIGDHLVQRQSPLAIPMSFKKDGKTFDHQAIADSIQASNGKLLIMVHGLCMNHLQWQQSGHDHGQRLADELGYTTLYLHYNTGAHICDNGETFSGLLEKIVSLLPANSDDEVLKISIVGHSMGGLVSRSAHHHAKENDFQWPIHFENLICLGTPHHGAPLEKAGNWLDLILGIHSYSAPLTRLTQIRSAGITDLRHGNIINANKHPRSRFDFSADRRTPLPLPDKVNCYAVATTSSSANNSISKQLVGDGLVPLDSALGKHQSKPFTLKFNEQHVASDVNHIELLSDLGIYDVLKRWLS